MGSLVRRVILLTLSLLAVMTLVAPSAHANHLGFDGRFVRCGFFTPAFVIPTSTGNIVILRDACGFERERFDPFRRRFFNDDFFDDGFTNGFNDGFGRFGGGGPRYTVIFNNF
jgi:hypothetical protein